MAQAGSFPEGFPRLKGLFIILLVIFCVSCASAELVKITDKELQIQKINISAENSSDPSGYAMVDRNLVKLTTSDSTVSSGTDKEESFDTIGDYRTVEITDPFLRTGSVLNNTKLSELIAIHNEKVTSLSSSPNSDTNECFIVANKAYGSGSFFDYQLRYINVMNGSEMNCQGLMMYDDHFNIIYGIKPVPLCSEDVCDPDNGSYALYLTPMIDINQNILYLYYFKVGSDGNIQKRNNEQISLGCQEEAYIDRTGFVYGFKSIPGILDDGMWTVTYTQKIEMTEADLQ